MDRVYLARIKEELDELFKYGVPSDQELDNDDDYIELYKHLIKINEQLEALGF